MQQRYVLFQGSKDGEKLAILNTVGPWSNCVFDTFEGAVLYADCWLGEYSPGFSSLLSILSNNSRYGYNGYGDYVVIRVKTDMSPSSSLD